MESTKQLNLALQSLCRFTMMKERKYPDIIVDLESEILDQRILSLSEDEISFLEKNFSKLYCEYLVDLEIDDNHLTRLLNKKINQMN